MVTTTFLGLNKPDKGTLDWNVPLNENFDLIDSFAANLGLKDAKFQSNIDGNGKYLTNLNRICSYYHGDRSGELKAYIILDTLDADPTNWWIDFVVNAQL